MKSTTLIILSLFIIQLKANRLLQQAEKCNGCISPITGECSLFAPCAPREYCPTDTASPFYKTCKAYPMAQCRFTGCGGCYEYFVDSLGNVVDCDVDDICSLPADVGPCDAAYPRYFYNSKTGQCDQFSYGGCDGNANNFENLQDCQTSCICSLPAETGLCKAAFPRYFYNSNTQQCELFTYGGCGGNANNFMTLQDCEAQCVADICSLPAVIGPCEGLFSRYYYNSKTGQCEKFNYGGCQGNDNNFAKLEQCQAACDPPVAGDSCGVQGVDCMALGAPAALCSDGKTCYGNCGGCIYTDDGTGKLVCSPQMTSGDVCPKEGDICGTQGVECPAIKAAAFTCPDGETCYANCGKCTLEDDGNGRLICTNMIPRDRVCPLKCCPPDTKPDGRNGNPLCFEGYACCADTGEWSCSIGDGETFSCGNIVNNPEKFGKDCAECTDLQCRNDKNECQTKTCLLDPCIDGNNGGCAKDEICTATTCVGPCTAICTPSVGCGIDHCTSYNDGCNDCTCFADGIAACTEKACLGLVAGRRRCTGCEFGYRLDENDKCVAKIGCTAHNDCDSSNGFRCKSDPECRGKRNLDRLCDVPPKVCVDCGRSNGSQCRANPGCASDGDCDVIDGFKCTGINNQGVGVCVKYQ